MIIECQNLLLVILDMITSASSRTDSRLPGPSNPTKVCAQFPYLALWCLYVPMEDKITYLNFRASCWDICAFDEGIDSMLKAPTVTHLHWRPGLHHDAAGQCCEHQPALPAHCAVRPAPAAAAPSAGPPGPWPAVARRWSPALLPPGSAAVQSPAELPARKENGIRDVAGRAQAQPAPN